MVVEQRGIERLHQREGIDEAAVGRADQRGAAVDVCRRTISTRT
jgi:hypothetical protein